MQQKNNKARLSFLALILALSPLLAAESPDVETILQAFNDSLKWQDDVSLRLTGTEWYFLTSDTVRHAEYVYHHDGKGRLRKIYDWHHVHKDTGEIVRGDDGQPRKLFSDGLCVDEAEGFCFSGMGDGNSKVIETLYIHEDGADCADRSIRRFSAIGLVLGRLPGTPGFVQNFLTADSVGSIEMEEMDGRPSYRVEVDLPEGSLSVWLSPEEGYAMQKWRLVSGMGEDPEGIKVLQALDPDAMDENTEKRVFECSYTNFQKVDNFHVPGEIKYTAWNEVGDKKELEREETAKITSVELSPDFDALGAFDFPDYSQVSSPRFIKKDGTGLSGFKWEDGKLVAPMDEDFVDSKLQERFNLITTGPSDETKEPAKLSLHVDNLDTGASVRIEKEKRLLILTVAGLIVLTSGWVVYKVIKKKSQHSGKAS